MPVLLACPTCLQKIRAPETVLGKQIKCPQCKNPFTAVDSAAPPTPLARTAVRESASASGPSVAEAEPAPPPVKSPSSAQLSIQDDEIEPLEPLPVSNNAFADFLLLKSAVAPRINVALFYIGLVAILVIGLVCFVAGIRMVMFGGFERTMGLILLIVTVLTTPLAVVVWRVFCEMVVAVFRERDNPRRRTSD